MRDFDVFHTKMSFPLAALSTFLAAQLLFVCAFHIWKTTCVYTYSVTDYSPWKYRRKYLTVWCHLLRCTTVFTILMSQATMYYTRNRKQKPFWQEKHYLSSIMLTYSALTIVNHNRMVYRLVFHFNKNIFILFHTLHVCKQSRYCLYHLVVHVQIIVPKMFSTWARKCSAEVRIFAPKHSYLTRILKRTLQTDKYQNILLYKKMACFHIWAASWQNQQNECSPSEDSDQPRHLPSLLRVFPVRSMGN